MGRTNRQRVKEWRAKKAKEGGRSLSVWMEPEIAGKLDSLREASGESTSLLVAQAIAALHDITCNNKNPSFPSSPSRSIGVSPGEVSPETGEEVSETALTRDESAAAGTVITCNDTHSDDGEGHIAAIDDSIAAITVTFEQNRTFSMIRERLAALLRHRIEEGVPYSALMKELNEANIPTPGGETVWRRGTIFGLLR